MKRGRKPLPAGFKKEKLTLSCKSENKEYLNTYCNNRGISISQLLDSIAEELREAEEKAKAKAARAAKKTSKEKEQLPGQITTEDLGI